MMAPGLIAIAFYRRWPGPGQIALGLGATVLLCALLGFVLPAGSLGRAGSVVLAVVGGVLLYFAILAYLYVRMQRRSAGPQPPGDPAP
jgi:hypothetical protein